MMVWRIQHECEGQHGPMSSTGCDHVDYYLTYGDRPKYGAIGSPPERIEQHERCGTTTEQFPQWWSPTVDWEKSTSSLIIPDSLPGDWAAVLFDVDDAHARIDNGQVVFNPKYAREVMRTRSDFPR